MKGPTHESLLRVSHLARYIQRSELREQVSISMLAISMREIMLVLSLRSHT